MDAADQELFVSKVAAARGQLHALPLKTLTVIDKQDPGLVERTQLVLDHVLTVTSTAVPELVPHPYTRDLHQALDEVVAAVASISTVDTSTLINGSLLASLSAATEAVTSELFQWPHQRGGGDWRDAVTQAATTYRRSLGQQLNAVVGELEALESMVATTQTALTEAASEATNGVIEQTRELHSRLSEAERAISAVDRARVTVNEQLTASIARSDAAIADQQARFAEAQERRTEEFKALAEDALEQAHAEFSDRRESADETVTSLRAKLAEAENLVSVFAAAGTANAFSKEAKDQAEIADKWRLGAIVLGAFAGIAALLVVFGETSADAWPAIVGKLALTVALGGVASYAARQSSRHRRREEEARNLELNIVAFGPFVQDLDEDARNLARAKVVDAIFMRDRSADTARATASPEPTGDQLNLIAALFERLVRGSPPNQG